MAERLALDVPQRHVDAAHRVDADAAPAAVDVAAVHLVPQIYSVSKGSSPDHELAQPGRGGVRERPLDGALGGQRRGVDLADAGDPGVGRDATISASWPLSHCSLTSGRRR